jgi:uncharacterized protein DUF4235
LVVEEKNLSWKAVSYGAGALAAMVTRRFLEASWRGLRNAPPPDVLADRRTPFVEALSWAIATGVGIGVARLFAIRTAAVVWEAATHELPPGGEANAHAVASSATDSVRRRFGGSLRTGR